MIILTDTREQLPYTFSKYPVQTEFAALAAGDYSLKGFQDRVAVERKSIDDLIGCLIGSDRNRFEKELARAGSFERFAVVIEASLQDVSAGRYKSDMKPHAALTVLKSTLESGFTVADGLGSFEDWNRTARAAVCYAESLGFPVADPALSIEASLTDDPETGKLRALLTVWEDVFGDTPTSAATAKATAETKQQYSNEPTNPALFDACEEIAGERGFINVRRLSRWIERNRDRIIDGMAFELTEIRTYGLKHWTVKTSF